MLIRTLVSITLATALLAGCSSTPEQLVARSADKMNGLDNKALDKARADGRTLIVRYKPLGVQSFSDSELLKLTTAGMCTIDGVENLLAKGGKIRMELPRGGPYLTIELDRCDAGKPVARIIS